MLYFLIEAEHSGTVYPLGVCEQAHSEDVGHPDIVLHSRPIPRGVDVFCGLVEPEDIESRMLDLLEWLRLRQKAQEYLYYVLRVDRRVVAVISASSQKDAELIAGRINSLLPDDSHVTPYFFSSGPASDYPEAFGGSPALLATRIKQFLSSE